MKRKSPRYATTMWRAVKWALGRNKDFDPLARVMETQGGCPIVFLLMSVYLTLHIATPEQRTEAIYGLYDDRRDQKAEEKAEEPPPPPKELRARRGPDADDE